jgi:hypothetical protein
MKNTFKRILSIALALLMVFALMSAVACGKEDELTGAQKTAQFYENSLPTKIVTTSAQSIVNDEGTVVATLNGKYELVTGTIAGKLATVQTYEQDYIREVAEGANAVIVGPIGTESGSLEYLEGYGRRTNGGFWDPNGLNFGPTAGSIAINLDESIIKNAKYTEGEDGTNTLTFTVANENIAAVFGANSDDTALLTASSDVEVIITNDGAFVNSITISYSIAGTRYYPERRVVMTTNYEYKSQRVELAY